MSQGDVEIAFAITSNLFVQCNAFFCHSTVTAVTLQTLSSRWHHNSGLDKNGSHSQRALDDSHSISMFVCASDMMS